MKAQSGSIIPNFLVITATANFLSEDARYEVVCHQLWFLLVFLCILTFARHQILIVIGCINLNYISI